MSKIKCKKCAKEFEKKVHNQVFCSRECKNKYHHKYQILCISCNWHKGRFGTYPEEEYNINDWIGGTA